MLVAMPPSRGRHASRDAQKFQRKESRQQQPGESPACVPAAIPFPAIEKDVPAQKLLIEAEVTPFLAEDVVNHGLGHKPKLFPPAQAQAKKHVLRGPDLR